MADNITLTGSTGTQYEYFIFNKEDDFKEVPANYVFARKNANSKYSVLYNGETENLSNRLKDHHKWDCANSHGMTHIFAHKSSSSAKARRNEEADLIEKYVPPCNG